MISEHDFRARLLVNVGSQATQPQPYTYHTSAMLWASSAGQEPATDMLGSLGLEIIESKEISAERQVEKHLGEARRHFDLLLVSLAVIHLAPVSFDVILSVGAPYGAL